MTKEIEVDCPCCESRLLIDVRTRAVLRHAPKERLDEFGKPMKDASRWDAANEKIGRGSERGKDAFDQALSKEKSRGEDLDDLFDRAKSKVDARKKKHE